MLQIFNCNFFLGKKNFLPPCQLVLGFGFLFRVSLSLVPRIWFQNLTLSHSQVEDTCIPNHLHERKVKGTEEENVVCSWITIITVKSVCRLYIVSIDYYKD